MTDSLERQRLYRSIEEQTEGTLGRINRERYLKRNPPPEISSVPSSESGLNIRKRNQIWYNAWSWEITSLITGSACLVGLVGLLSYLQNKPQPEWASKITLNMVISLLTTLSRGSMMYVVASCISQLKWNYFTGRTGRHRLFDFEVFDQASRGPMGAANFLARIPPSIASLGSFLTITALAISPFSQQVAKYRTEDVFKDDRGASFGVALEYTGTVNNGGNAPLSSSIDWEMQGSILKGIYNLDLAPPFNCTSSCVWEGSYITLGFGASCRDVSDATLRTRRCSDSHPATDSQYCNLTTPGGVKLQTAFVPTMYIGTKILPPWRFLSDAWQHDSSIVISPDFLNLAEYRAVLRVPNYLVTDSTNYTEYITECTLSLTAYNMSNVSTDGNIFTVGSRQRISIRNAYPSAVLGPESDQYKFNTTPGLPVFNASFYDWAAIAKYLEQQLDNVSNEVGDESKIALGAGLALSSPSAGNITDWLERVASSLTDTLRSGRNTQLAYGKVSQPVIFVEVRLEWLTLPFAVAVGAILFLIFTVWSTCRAQVVLWKTSMLALLFHHLDQSEDLNEHDTLMISDVQNYEDLKALARSKSMALAI